jgi:adhesin HecA-like repeat protein
MGGEVNNANEAVINGDAITFVSVSSFVNEGNITTNGLLSGSIGNLNNINKISAQKIDLKNTNITQKGNLTATGQMDIKGVSLDNGGLIKAANLTITYNDFISRAGEMNGSAALNLTASRSFTDEKKGEKSTILKSADIITLTMPKTDIGFWGSIMGRSVVWNNGKKLTLGNFVAGDTSLTFNTLDEIKVEESATISSNDLKINNVKTNIEGNLKGEKANINGSKIRFGKKSIITLINAKKDKNLAALTIVSDDIDIKGEHKSLGNVTLTGSVVPFADGSVKHKGKVRLADVMPCRTVMIGAETVDLASDTNLTVDIDVIMNADTITQDGSIAANKKDSQTKLKGITQNINGKIKSTNLTLAGNTANINGTIESALSAYNNEIVNINENAKLEKKTHRFTEKVRTLNLTGAITCEKLEIYKTTNVLFNKGSAITIPHDFKHIRRDALNVDTNITTKKNIHIESVGLLKKTGIFTSGGNIDLKGSSVEDFGETYAIDEIEGKPNGIVTYNSPSSFPILPGENKLIAKEVKIISNGDANIQTPIQTANLSLKVPGNINVNAALNHDVISLTSTKGSINIKNQLHSNSTLTLNANEGIIIGAPLTAKGDIVCDSKTYVEINKSIISDGNITCNSGSYIKADKLIKSEGCITLKSATNIYIDSIDTAQYVSIYANGEIRAASTIVAGADINITSFTNAILLNGPLTSPKTISLNAKGHLETKDVFGGNIILIAEAADIINENVLYSAGIKTDGPYGESIYGDGELTIKARSLTNLSGYIISKDKLNITTSGDCLNRTGYILARGFSEFRVMGNFYNLNDPNAGLVYHSHYNIATLYNELNDIDRKQSHLRFKGGVFLLCEGDFINENAQMMLKGESEFQCHKKFVNKNSKIWFYDNTELKFYNGFENTNSKFLSAGHLKGFVYKTIFNDVDSIISFEGSVNLKDIKTLKNDGVLRFGEKVDDNTSCHENFILSTENVNNYGTIRALNGLTLNVSNKIRNFRNITVFGHFLANTPFLDNSYVYGKPSFPFINVDGHFIVGNGHGVLWNIGYSVPKSPGPDIDRPAEHSPYVTTFINNHVAQRNCDTNLSWSASPARYVLKNEKLNLSVDGPKINCTQTMDVGNLKNSYGIIHARAKNIRNDSTSTVYLAA